MGYLLNPISFQAHAASPSGRSIGSIEVDENLYARSIVPIDLHRPSLEADELFASDLRARVGDALRLHVARVFVEVLAQDVRAHVAPDCRKEVGGGAAPRRSLPAVDERDDRMDDGGNSPRLQLESAPIPFTPLRRPLLGSVLQIPRLEFLGAEVPQRRVYADPVVEALDVLEYLQRRPLPGLERARVHTLGFYEAHERLHRRVVPRRRYGSHRGLDAGVAHGPAQKQGDVLAAVDAPLSVKSNSRFCIAF